MRGEGRNHRSHVRLLDLTRFLCKVDPLILVFVLHGFFFVSTLTDTIVRRRYHRLQSRGITDVTTCQVSLQIVVTFGSQWSTSPQVVVTNEWELFILHTMTRFLDNDGPKVYKKLRTDTRFWWRRSKMVNIFNRKKEGFTQSMRTNVGFPDRSCAKKRDTWQRLWGTE